MIPRSMMTIVAVMAIFAVVAIIRGGPAPGGVILYPDVGFSPPSAGVLNQVELDDCISYVSPRGASSSANETNLRVLLFATSNCTGVPVGTLDPRSRLAEHIPISSIQAITAG